ncbi:hypothetical protein [Kytococcus sedentarius]|uniref:hypothetical protein n=1 Tax=Kytococcus sedentarius TaxID=1276 RepID=UPI0035BC322D
MPPSLLVLVLVVLVWIGFGVQWWWKRRDHVRTVKSMDAFLDAMEALENTVQMPNPRSDLDHRPAQQVSPTAAMEPTVTVKPRRDEADVARAHAREAERRARAEQGADLFTLGSMREQLADKSVRAGLLIVSALGLLVTFGGALVGALSWFWVAFFVLAVAVNVAWSRKCAEMQVRGTGLRITGVRRGAQEAPARGRSASGRSRATRPSRSNAPARAQRTHRRAAAPQTHRRVGKGVRVTSKRPAARR